MVNYQTPPALGGHDVSGARTFDDNRSAVRHRLARETATIAYGDRMLVADLVNISGGGAMIEADIAPRLWDRVDLYLGTGAPIECAVRWLRGGRIGLEFAHETQIDADPDDRDAVLREVIRRNFPDSVPELRPAPPTELPRRTAHRHPLIWNGTIVWQDEPRKVRLRNISETGVLVDAHVDLPEGAELTLDLGASGTYAVTVGWSRGGQAGLVFHDRFQLSALAAKRPDVAPHRWKPPAFLDRSADDGSPWAAEWRRRDLRDLGLDLAG